MKVIKKLVAFGLMVFMLASLVGCGTSGGNQETSNTEKQETGVTSQQTENNSETPDQAATESEVKSTEENEQTENSGSNILVVYFSRTGEQYTVGVIDKGNTAIVAEMIADQTGADLWEVLPAEDIYPTDSYDNLIDVAKKEQNDNARPAYAGEVPDLSQYDTIFIGAPVWWGDWPMIMYTFFENNQDGLSGKTLVPFSTHEGSGLSGFDRKLSSACPNSTVLEGLAIRGNDAQNKQDNVRETVNDWISSLGY